MTTLSQLKVSVDSWLLRDDVAVSGSDFPQILLIAESMISRDLRVAVQEVTTTIVITDRSAFLPVDFLEARNLFIDDDVRKIEYMTPQAIRESKAWNDGRAGAFYTIEGNNSTPLPAAGNLQITIAGPGSVATPLNLVLNYWAKFRALTVDPDTNWLLTNHYDIYLYATLRAAGEYLQEDTLEDRYAVKYLKVVGDQNRHENRKRYGAMPKQSYGNPRTVV